MAFKRHSSELNDLLNCTDNSSDDEPPTKTILSTSSQPRFKSTNTSSSTTSTASSLSADSPISETTATSVSNAPSARKSVKERLGANKLVSDGKKIWQIGNNVPSERIRRFISCEFNILSRKLNQAIFARDAKHKELCEKNDRISILEDTFKKMQKVDSEQKAQIVRLQKAVDVLSKS